MQATRQKSQSSSGLKYSVMSQGSRRSKPLAHQSLKSKSKGEKGATPRPRSDYMQQLLKGTQTIRNVQKTATLTSSMFDHDFESDRKLEETINIPTLESNEKYNMLNGDRHGAEVVPRTEP